MQTWARRRRGPWRWGWAARRRGGTVTGIEETSLRALTKLEQTLPARLRHRLDALRQATVSAAGGGPTVDAETLMAIAGACRDHEQLRFDYRGHDGEASARRVEPHRLVYTGRRWYLLAWDRDRQDWRTFGPTASARACRPGRGSRRASRPRTPRATCARDRLAGRAHPARVRLHDPWRSSPSASRPRRPAAPYRRARCLLETGADSLRDLVGFLTSSTSPRGAGPAAAARPLRELAERYAAAAVDPPG